MVRMKVIKNAAIIMMSIVFTIGFIGCGNDIKKLGKQKYVDTSDRRTRSELIADFKKEFEGKCILPEENWCRCKIRDVTPSGFFYGVAKSLDSTGYIYENIFYRFSNKPIFKEKTVADAKYFEISPEKTSYPPMRTLNEEQAFKIYGLLESIYQIY